MKIKSIVLVVVLLAVTAISAGPNPNGNQIPVPDSNLQIPPVPAPAPALPTLPAAIPKVSAPALPTPTALPTLPSGVQIPTTPALPTVPSNGSALPIGCPLPDLKSITNVTGIEAASGFLKMCDVLKSLPSAQTGCLPGVISLLGDAFLAKFASLTANTAFAVVNAMQGALVIVGFVLVGLGIQIVAAANNVINVVKAIILCFIGGSGVPSTNLANLTNELVAVVRSISCVLKAAQSQALTKDVIYGIAAIYLLLSGISALVVSVLCTSLQTLSTIQLSVIVILTGLSTNCNSAVGLIITLTVIGVPELNMIAASNDLCFADLTNQCAALYGETFDVSLCSVAGVAEIDVWIAMDSVEYAIGFALGQAGSNLCTTEAALSVAITKVITTFKLIIYVIFAIEAGQIELCNIATLLAVLINSLVNDLVCLLTVALSFVITSALASVFYIVFGLTSVLIAGLTTLVAGLLQVAAGIALIVILSLPAAIAGVIAAASAVAVCDLAGQLQNALAIIPNICLPTISSLDELLTILQGFGGKWSSITQCFASM